METKKHVFTNIEKKCFLDIIKKFSKVIENKNTDGTTLRRKNQAWDKVTAEFNASPLTTSQATHKQLRRLWMNLKQRHREALRKKRQHRLGIAEGASANNRDIDPLASIVTPAVTVGTDTAIDSDTIQDKMNTPDVEMKKEPVTVQEVTIVLREQPSTRETTFMESFDTVLEQPSISLSTPPPSTLRGASLNREKCTQCANRNNMEKEINDQQNLANERHELELQILKEQLRESKAKADLAELLLKHKQSVLGIITREKQDDEKYELELQILREQLRESKAKGDIAELILYEQSL